MVDGPDADRRAPTTPDVMAMRSTYPMLRALRAVLFAVFAVVCLPALCAQQAAPFRVCPLYTSDASYQSRVLNLCLSRILTITKDINANGKS